MYSENARHQNFALFIVLAGILAYIAVDSNIIPWLSATVATATPPSPKVPEQNLKAYSDKISDELGAVEKGLNTEKSNLSDLQKKVAFYEKSVATHKQNLKSLNKEIYALSRLKRTLATAPIARPNGEVTSLNNLATSLRQLTKIDTTIEPIQYGSEQFVRLKTKIDYFEGNGIFLNSRGTQQAAIFTEGVMANGYGKVRLAYNSSDNQILERAGVIERFLKKRYGDYVSIRRKKVASSVDLVDGLEIWAGMSNEGGQGE